VVSAPEAEVTCRLRVTYIGHATLLLELGSVRILTDPNFDSRLGWILPRVSPPGIALDQLPVIDGLLLTHAHADHLSYRSLQALPAGIAIYAPPSVAHSLKRRGHTQVVPIARGDSVHIGPVQITAGEARHVGARYSIDRWRAEANMYTLVSDRVSCFFAGDTGVTGSTAEFVGKQLGSRRLDVAFLPIGYAPWWKRKAFRRGHLMPTDALTLFEQLRARYLIPYHWGTFRHVTSGPHDAIRILRAELARFARGSDVRVLPPGSVFELVD
jgi:L-ascorbate metabolism protein UlaG (beta-lactamase superfamily)